METIRKEILPGVWLTALENDKFKTGSPPSLTGCTAAISSPWCARSVRSSA